MRRRAPKPADLHAVDVHVGGRLRLRRILRGMSQDELAQAIGLTFQQVQKYEQGKNRISAGMLMKLSRVLDVPVTFFFEAAPGGCSPAGGNTFQSETAAARTGQEEAPFCGAGEDGAPRRLAVVDDSTLLRRESLELVRAWYRVTDIRLRHRLLAVIRGLAAPAG